MDYLECNTIADVAKALEKKAAAEKSKRGRRASNKKS